MNRIIKFRAWDKKREIFWEPIELTKLLGYLFLQPMPNATAYTEIKSHFQEVVWLEWTGLKDKNGKEIYESDLVKDGKKTFKVFWNNLGSGGWWFAFKSKEGEWQHTNKINVSQLEVVGNIYETDEKTIK